MPSSLNLKMKMSVNGTSSADWEMNKNKRQIFILFLKFILKAFILNFFINFFEFILIL